MKLNATTEMEPITWPEFADLHPFAPADADRRATLELIGQLEGWLAEITGYDAVSVQPNAGSQGELAGLLAIRAYHRSRGDAGPRRLPDPVQRARHQRRQRGDGRHAGGRGRPATPTATSTWPTCDAKIDKHRDALAAIMVTYPSTHGVYESGIAELCAKVHDAGGQVYVDGANLNALVGFARPGRFGADVSHLNLHKTFCIPHGGGGPGVGPVAVRAHLAPFLPDHPLARPASAAGRADLGGAVRLGRHPADPVGVHPADGRRTGWPGRPGWRCWRPTTWPRGCASTSRCSTPATRAWSRTSASWTCGRSPRRPASPSTTWPSGWSTTASTRRRCRSRWPAR